MKVSAVVVPGKKEGRKMGYPTANIPLPRGMKGGVYKGTVVVGKDVYKAACFVDVARNVVEAHLIGFSGELYGTEIQITLGAKIRDSIPFSTEKEMRSRIAEDVAVASL